MDNLPAQANNNAVSTETVEQTVDTTMQVVMNFVKRESRQEKITLLNALDNADKKLADCIGQKIVVKGIYAETHFSIKKQKQVCRVLLIDDNNTSYATGSFVFMNSLKNITDIFGDPTVDPFTIEVVEKPMERGNAITAKVVE